MKCVAQGKLIPAWKMLLALSQWRFLGLEIPGFYFHFSCLNSHRLDWTTLEVFSSPRDPVILSLHELLSLDAWLGVT